MEKAFRIFVEIIFGLQIAAAPTAIGIILGFLIYLIFPTDGGMVMAVGFAIIGLFVGIVWAVRTALTQGSANFMSRINATPELDNKDQPQDEDKNKG
ncbi:MAG: hypothetical protein IT259_13720 [Saprospiraceae bacterium]|nr:hypothetical protein [Saprospiraceae bacterium]